ncbi:unnamed protein product [Trichobilharzia szidati]|nr:unnamed protein product [Trichobilharzia szidati]
MSLWDITYTDTVLFADYCNELICLVIINDMIILYHYKELQMSQLSETYSLLKRPKVREFCKSNQPSRLSLGDISHPGGNAYTNLHFISSIKHNLNSDAGTGIAIKSKNNNERAQEFCYSDNNKTVSNEPTTQITKLLRLLPRDNQKCAGRKITVVRCNPDGKGRTSVTVIMVRRAVHTLGQVMCELSEAFGARWHNDPIRHLYSLTGREIRSVNELFRKEKVFIASGIYKLFGNIHFDLTKNSNNNNCIFNNINHNNDNNNNSTNNYTHQLLNYNNQHYYGLHSNQDKNHIAANSIMYLKPEDIRIILSEFWPDHPDPSSVVYQWERRLRNRGIGVVSQQFETDKNQLFETSKSKQIVPSKVNNNNNNNNSISSVKYTSSESLLENEKKDSGFDESNNILPKIDEEQFLQGENFTTPTKISLNLTKDSPTKSPVKAVKNIIPTQIPGYGKTNFHLPHSKNHNSPLSVAQDDNSSLLEKSIVELSLHEKVNATLGEKYQNTTTTTEITGSMLLTKQNISKNNANSMIHLNSIVPSLPFCHSIYPQHHFKGLQQQKLQSNNLHLSLSSFPLQQQQIKCQQLRKPDSLSKLLSKYHNRLQIGEKVLQSVEQRRDELATKENRLPLVETQDDTLRKTETPEKVPVKSNDCQTNKLCHQTIPTTNLTTDTTNNEKFEGVSTTVLHNMKSIKQPKLTNQTIKSKHFNLNQQIKVNPVIANNTDKNNRGDPTGINGNRQIDKYSNEVPSQSDPKLLLKQNIKVNENNNNNNKAWIDKDQEQKIDQEEKNHATSHNIPTVNHTPNHYQHHSENNQIELKNKQAFNEISTAVQNTPHNLHVNEIDLSRTKSLSNDHKLDNGKHESFEQLPNKTFDNEKNDVKLNGEEKHPQTAITNDTVPVVTQKQMKNAAIRDKNYAAGITTNSSSPIKSLNANDATKNKLMANCSTVNVIKKSDRDETKSLYASIGVTYVPDPEFLSKRYHIGRKLGDGNFAIVKLGKRRDTNDQYAVKIIDKNKITGKEAMLLNEISILHHCSHPNIVRLYEEFETSNEIWLVMEFVKDGDLFDGITQATKFTEPVAAGIVSDLANALFYLHCRSIVHRDLKPENVLLLRQKNGQIRVKLADFGLAIVVKRNMFTVCGTPTYIAPEILQESGYGLEVDMWALGIITYIMLCGFAPFRSPNRRQSMLFESIKRGQFVFLSPYWDNISSCAKDLITALLVVTPKSRLTARETLIHPWVFGLGSPSSSEEFEKRRLDYQKELEQIQHTTKQSNIEKITGNLINNYHTTNKSNTNESNINAIKKVELPKVVKMNGVQD